MFRDGATIGKPQLTDVLYWGVGPDFGSQTHDVKLVGYVPPLTSNTTTGGMSQATYTTAASVLK